MLRLFLAALLFCLLLPLSAQVVYTGPPPRIRTTDLQEGSVTSSKIADGSINSIDLKDGSVTNAKVAAGAITSTKIAASGVVSANITNSAVTANKILDSTITANKIATGGVNTYSILDSTITISDLDTTVLYYFAILSGGTIDTTALLPDGLSLNLAGLTVSVNNTWLRDNSTLASTYTAVQGNSTGPSQYDSLGMDAYKERYLIKPGANLAAMQSKLDQISAIDSAVSIEFERGGVYNLSGTLKIQAKDGMSINFNQAEFIGSSSESGIQIASDTSSSGQYLLTSLGPGDFARQPTKGDGYLVVDDISNWPTFSKGDIIILSDSTSYRDDGSPTYTNSIQVYFDSLGANASPDTIYLENTLQASIDTTKLFVSGGEYAIYHIPLKRSINISNGNFNNTFLHVHGFEHTNISGIYTESNTATSIQPNAAIEVRGSFATLSNIVGRGFDKVGFGYFISLPIFRDVKISNMIGINNRHSITTTSTSRNRNGRLTIENSSSIFTEDFKNTYPAYDTHGQVEEIVISNSYAKNASHFLQVRGQSAYLYNNRSEGLSASVAALVHTEETAEKQEVVIDGGNYQALRLVSLGDSTRIGKVVVNGVTFKQYENSSNGDQILLVTGAAHIDSLVVTNNNIKGSPNNTGTTGDAIFRGFTPSDPNLTNSVTNFLFSKNSIDGIFQVFNLSDVDAVYNLEVERNNFTRIGEILYCNESAVDTASISLFGFKFNLNSFDRVREVFDFDQIFRVRRLELTHNSFVNVANTGLLTNLYADQLSIIDNDYYNSPYNYTYAFRTVANTNFFDLLNFKQNTFYEWDEALYDSAYAADNTKGYMTTHTGASVVGLFEKSTGYFPYLKFQDNKMYNEGNASVAFLSVDSHRVVISGNAFEPDSIADDKFVYLDDVSGEVRNNSFSTSVTADGAVIRVIGSSSLSIKDNSFSIDAPNNIYNLVRKPLGSSVSWQAEFSPLDWRAKMDSTIDERQVFKNLTSQGRRTGGTINFPSRDTLYLGKAALIDSGMGSNTVWNFNQSTLMIKRAGGISSSSVGEVTNNVVMRDGIIVTSPPDQTQGYSYAFNFKQDSSLTFENMQFYTHGAGLDFDDSTEVIRINNCLFAPDDSIGIGNLNIGDGARDVRITNSTFKNSQGAYINQIPLNYKGLGPVYIAGNNFGYNDYIVSYGGKGGKSVLIELTNDEGADSQLVFIGNTIDIQGIINYENPIPDTQHVLGAAFIGVSRAIISNNEIKGDTTGSPGENIGMLIGASDEQAALRDITVSNNRISNFYGGIRLALVANSKFGDFHFNNNDIEGCPNYAYQFDLTDAGAITSATYDSVAYITVDGGNIKKSGYLYLAGDADGNGDGLLHFTVKNLVQIDTTLDGNLIKLANPEGIYISVDNNTLDPNGQLFIPSEFDNIDFNTLKYFSSNDIESIEFNPYVAVADTVYRYIGTGFLPMRAIVTTTRSIGSTPGAFDLIFQGVAGTTHNKTGTHTFKASSSVGDTLRYVMSDFISNSLALQNLGNGTYFGAMLISDGNGTGGGRANVTLQYIRNSRD